ncbi:hypothetical protein PHLCEN_2v11320 [Hermanssonia centrifuga]|uniref:Symplekin n=1 Tax=Hermanssonia centrifuga TaxID=98765 RepID=A0A2R6NKD7_9APHY|nr:hypothetical protein PHLCEN_2v11320 [Hermanssonia centrifuga]
MSVPALEAEGLKLLEGVITILYTSQNTDILSSILNSWSSLTKQRPALVELVVSTLASWTPAKLAGLPAFSIKSVEKGVRILLMHIMRGPQGAQFGGQIQAALATQAQRMEAAAIEEKQRKLAVVESRKRPPSAIPTTDTPDTKRQKLVADTSSPSATFLSGFDFTSLPASLVTDLIVANLQAFSEPALIGLVQAYRHGKTVSSASTSPAAIASSSGHTPTPPPTSQAIPSAPVVPVPPIGPSRSHVSPPTGPTTSEYPTPVPEFLRKVEISRQQSQTPPVVKEEEPVDPLQMDIDEEELEYEPDKLNLELSGDQEEAAEEGLSLDQDMNISLDNQEFKLTAPKDLPEEAKEALVRSSLVRIWDGAKDLASHDMVIDAGDASGTTPADMWMLLLVRLITRVVDPTSSDSDPDDDGTEMDEDSKVSLLYAHQDRLRQTLCDYIMADFSARVRLATTWMNEEWYNDQIRSQDERNWRPNYEIWLNQLVAVYQTHLDNKDRTFSRFLLDLPAVPPDVMSLLREMCVEPDRRQVGFAALREFVAQRPSLRAEAMNMLLELTTHADKITRGAAINTVKRWIPDSEPMAGMIRDFALQLLRRLQSRPKDHQPPETQTNGNVDGIHDENMEDGQLPQEEIIQTPYLPEQLELPAESDQILQHLELLFALSTKVPEFLDEIFAAYGGMEETVQETVQQLITPLIRALGSSHGKLLTLLRTFPPGAETLALRVLTIFTENGRPSGQLVALVKSLINERDLDARFLIPIIAEMDKADILRHLPRIVSILNGKQEPKNLVRSVFSSIVTTPPQTFGSVTSNLPRDRQTELLTPAELMVLLHESEKEIGLKAAIEAIGVCFSMSDIFRSEILAVVMNQLVDEPVLPTLFLRTVIQAVTTYRSLVSFVSSTLLTRLITKKIWTNPPLWEGFIRCAKVIAPASFGALLQLPKDQLRELADKQPSLKAGLREYVMKKAGNKARVAGLLDIFSEDDSNATAAKSASESPMAEVIPLPEEQMVVEAPPQS